MSSRERAYLEDVRDRESCRRWDDAVSHGHRRQGNDLLAADVRYGSALDGLPTSDRRSSSGQRSHRGTRDAFPRLVGVRSRQHFVSGKQRSGRGGRRQIPSSGCPPEATRSATYMTIFSSAPTDTSAATLASAIGGAGNATSRRGSWSTRPIDLHARSCDQGRRHCQRTTVDAITDNDATLDN